MIIISNYILINNDDGQILVKSTGDIPPCPYCSCDLKLRDKRRRISRKEGGEKQWFLISRCKCSKCQSLHNMLPDCLIPYKHYESEVISGTIDGIVLPDDTDSEDYPCMMTMLRWLAWFRANLTNIEGYLRRAYQRINGFKDAILINGSSPLGAIRKKNDRWLETVMRIVYNSGGFLGAV